MIELSLDKINFSSSSSSLGNKVAFIALLSIKSLRERKNKKNKKIILVLKNFNHKKNYDRSHEILKDLVQRIY